MTLDENASTDDVKFGIILMVDALGVSSYSIEECKKFSNYSA